MVLVPVDPDSPADADVISRASVDALVLMSLPDDDPLIEAASVRGVPSVTIDQPLLDGVAFVGIDDRAATREAADHLLDLGHRRVAFVSYRLAPDRRRGLVPSARLRTPRYRLTRERLAGFRLALGERSSLDLSEALLYECEANSPAAGEAATRDLLEQPHPPTALLFDSDQLALGALATARRRGFTIPDDLSVVGLDDIPAAAITAPPLTTVHQPLADKGRTAARWLLDSQPEQARRALLPARLIVRRSTAPPPGSSSGR